jgi:hypothetical protein
MGKRINGVELDPLVGANDSSKPLLSKLLAVPALKQRYLGCVRQIAEHWLDWNNLGPLVRAYQALIADDVKADTRKRDSFEAFTNGLAGETVIEGGGGPSRSLSLKGFAEQRRAYLLKYQAGNAASR